MKTYIYHPLILLVIILVTVSCENELPFNIKDNPPKLVMNAFINADSMTNVLFLNLTGKDYANHIENATVEVHVNGELRETLRPLPMETEYDKQCRFNITGKFASGEVVRIDAMTDDGKYHAWAEITVPQRLDKIENIDTLTVPLVDKQMRLWGYNHEEGGEDYLHWTKHITYSFIGREDIVLTDGQPSTGDDEDNGLFDTAKNIYGVFDDSRFRDTSYTMTVYNDPAIPYNNNYNGYYEGMDVIIRLLSITETEYYYLKALNLVDSDAYDETINEPIKYPSNVHGGIGMIGISTETSKIIHIEKPQR